MYKSTLEVNDTSFSSLYGSDVASLTQVKIFHLRKACVLGF